MPLTESCVRGNVRTRSSPPRLTLNVLLSGQTQSFFTDQEGCWGVGGSVDLSSTVAHGEISPCGRPQWIFQEPNQFATFLQITPASSLPSAKPCMPLVLSRPQTPAMPPTPHPHGTTRRYDSRHTYIFIKPVKLNLAGRGSRPLSAAWVGWHS